MGTLQQFDFEGGTNGGAATTGTTGASAVSGGGVFTHQASAAKVGTLGLQVSGATGSVNARFALTSALSAAVKFWFKPPATSAGQTLRTFATLRSGAGVIGRWQYSFATSTTVTVQFLPAAGGSAIALGTFTSGSFYRISAWFTVATSTTGAAHHRVFDSTGTQVGSDVDVTNANLGTVNIEAVDLGSLGSFAEGPTNQFDDLQTEDGRTSYLPDAVDYTANPADTAGATDTATPVQDIVESLADSASVTDLSGPQVIDYGSSTSDAGAGTDTATTAVNFARAAGDAGGGTDTAAAAAAFVRAAADAAGITDSVTALLSWLLTPADPAGATDQVTTVVTAAKLPADPAGGTDTSTSTLAASRAAGDPAGGTDQTALARGSGTADPAGGTDQVSIVLTLQRVVTDTAGATDARTITIELPVPAGTPAYRIIRTRTAQRNLLGGGNRTIKAMKRRQ